MVKVCSEQRGGCAKSLRWETRVAGEEEMMEPVEGAGRGGVCSRTLESVERTLDFHSKGDRKTLKE